MYFETSDYKYLIQHVNDVTSQACDINCAVNTGNFNELVSSSIVDLTLDSLYSLNLNANLRNTFWLKSPETITIVKGGLQYTSIICQVGTELPTCVYRVPFSGYSGVGGFNESLSSQAFEYSLVLQTDPSSAPPGWIYIEGQTINIISPLTEDMITENLNVLIKADYYGTADG